MGWWLRWENEQKTLPQRFDRCPVGRIGSPAAARHRRGHPRTTDLREVVNGILYVLRGGIPWRLMPHDLPPWGTVWRYFRKWRDDGIWERVEALRARVREAAGREATPSAGIIDSQSVQTTEKGGRGVTTLANG